MSRKSIQLWSQIALFVFAIVAISQIIVPPRPAVAQDEAQVKIDPRQDAHAIPPDRGAGALWESLLKLHTRASMMMITAHPDDEDGGTLTYESRGLGARVALMTLNRGEGGANVMSADLWDALGLVRTEELLQADRYYGVQQYFSTVADYGFSKTLDEALQKWGHDRLLYDVVRTVRITRPLVITSVFVGGPSDGHGNHAAAGRLAQEVFTAAGNPDIFPDQIRAGLRPWNPVKEYARVPFSLEKGSVSPKGLYDYATHHWRPAGVQNYIKDRFEPGAVSADVEIPVGEYDTILGQSYLQIAREGLGYQKSQNGGVEIPNLGPVFSSYHRFGSSIPTHAKENSFFDGIDVSLLGIATLAGNEDHRFLTEGLSQINGIVEEAMHDFSPNNPGESAPSLAKGMQATDGLIGKVQQSALSRQAKYDVLHELNVKHAQFNTALCQALGLSLAATAAPAHPPTGPFARFMGTRPTFQMAIPGQHFSVNVHLANSGSQEVTIETITLKPVQDEPAPDGTWNIVDHNSPKGTLLAGRVVDEHIDVQAPDRSVFTQPYFQRTDIEQPYYKIIDNKYLGMPFAPYLLNAWASVLFQGASLQLGEVVQIAQRVVGPGLVLNPMPVGPAISLTITPRAGIVPLNRKTFIVHALIHSNVKGSAKGSVHLNLPDGWLSEPAVAPFSTQQDGDEQSINFSVHPHGLQEKTYKITAVADYAGTSYAGGYKTVGYPGLRPYFLYRSSSYTTTGTDVKVQPDLVVGYIEGSGDDMPQSLDNLGVDVHFITAQDLASTDLTRYNVIVIGVRAYAVRNDLRTYNGKILDYVKNGGVVIVQYQTPEFDHNYGPYPYTMTSDPEEVTDENSHVTIIDPNNPVFSWPNQISEKDFQGWIEERGSKFMQSWDPRYKPLLETHDPEQDPQKGGMLYANYGKGIYVYTAYAFYRELPLGVPGAYKIFANLLSLPHSLPTRFQPPDSVNHATGNAN